METLSATLTPATAARALPHPSALRIRLAITESQAAEIGILDRWQAAQQKKLKNAERKLTAETLLQERFAGLLAFAEMQSKPWSQRKLAKAIKIPERTLRRIRDRKVNPLVWLPKIEAAANLLKAS